ncbi:MAG TPA: metal-dependent hydrolase [Acidobacteria bacterium]|nr:metal-dependent hydrolase [Acidobacteriota bacterium]
METRLELGDLTIDVTLKDIKNVHLSVLPPEGRVRIAAPRRTSLETLRIFAIGKLGWIRKQQAKLREQERETPRDYVDRESHYVWGRRVLLEVEESDEPPGVELKHRRLVVRVRPGTEAGRRQALVEGWYREQLKEAVPPLLARWQPVLGVRAERWFVQRMKTRWGSCNHRARTIRLNTELAKKPVECLEYIVVHELVHLLEPTHNARFIAWMDRFMPRWQHHRQVLNRLPVRQETWIY